MLYKGQLLKGKMSELNISVEQVVRLAKKRKKKISKNTVSSARNSRDIRVSKLTIVADIVGVPMSDLFKEQENAEVQSV